MKINRLTSYWDAQHLKALFEAERHDFSEPTLRQLRAEIALDSNGIQVDDLDAMQLPEFVSVLAKYWNRPDPTKANPRFVPYPQNGHVHQRLYDDLDGGADSGVSQITESDEKMQTHETGDRDVIISHGDGCYSINGLDPISVDGNDDLVLQAFVNRSAYDLKGLRQATNLPRPNDVLKRLCEKYGEAFAPAIFRPLSRSKGGYRVKIRVAQNPHNICTSSALQI